MMILCYNVKYILIEIEVSLKADNVKKGQIIKAMSGFYYIVCDQKIYQTRARGNFRKQKITPLVGDKVSFESTNEKEGVILTIEPRKNMLVRPAIANVDIGLIVISATSPDFSSFLLDRYLVMLEKNSIQPYIYMSKCDLLSDDEIKRIKLYQNYYEKMGYDFILSTECNKDSFLMGLKNKVSVLIGQSGAGKSTMLNTFFPHLKINVQEISNYLGRGKHTTRHVEIYRESGCYIADTPGFSALEFADFTVEELKKYFVDFEAISHLCQFRECNHINEPRCQVKLLKDDNQIARERYEHYLQFFDEIKQMKKY